MHCRGVRTAGGAPCLAHLEPGARAAHLAARAPGDGIDLGEPVLFGLTVLAVRGRVERG